MQISQVGAAAGAAVLTTHGVSADRIAARGASDSDPRLGPTANRRAELTMSLTLPRVHSLDAQNSEITTEDRRMA